MSRNVWISKVDDIAERELGFSVFDLPDADVDMLFKMYAKGKTPTRALEIIHNIQLVVT